ncbi:MAG TPA: ankyrin repeat domain-containing protein [Conexibacter sp.]|nr:ankyrin repeat domain-containing protein [Conexibacter sp.]
MSEERFEQARRALDAHDVERLRALLDADPALVGARGGTNRNDLLGMAAATRDERLVTLLLERGADPAAANVHGWTALHQAAYVGLPALAALLLDAGAPARGEARGAGGTPLVVALFWGHATTAELLAARAGRAPGSLRVAAGLGDLALIEQLWPVGGEPSAAAGAARAFHRPHTGFPAWTPADDPQEIVDEALAWAARNDRADALDPLVARGARLDADVYRGSALAWAAACGALGALDRLLALGADPNGRGSFGGLEHGEGVSALHLAAQDGRIEAIERLLAAGADRTIRDALHGLTAAEWARYGRHDGAVALLGG